MRLWWVVCCRSIIPNIHLLHLLHLLAHVPYHCLYSKLYLKLIYSVHFMLFVENLFSLYCFTVKQESLIVKCNAFGNYTLFCTFLLNILKLCVDFFICIHFCTRCSKLCHNLSTKPVIHYSYNYIVLIYW